MKTADSNGNGHRGGFSIGDHHTQHENHAARPDLERIWARRLEEFAMPGLFDGLCPCCGGPASLVEVGHSVYVRAPGVPAPDERVHPAAEGWAA